MNARSRDGKGSSRNSCVQASQRPNRITLASTNFNTKALSNQSLKRITFASSNFSAATLTSLPLKRITLASSNFNADALPGKRRRLHSQQADVLWISSSSSPDEESDDESVEENDVPMKPSQHLQTLLQARGIAYSVSPSPSLNNFFIEPNEENYASYAADSIKAIRERDLERLGQMVKSGRTLQSCNMFGESLIHMACRRGFTEVVSFLIEEGKVSLRVKDDFGRTPMHDACWTLGLKTDLMDVLISEDSSLLFLSDKRGHTPLDYVRREDWKSWNDFLTSRLDTIIQKSTNLALLTKNK